MPDRFTRLLHPAFLAALAALAVNDHVLKAAAPSALTGKLSDVAGLVVLPVLLCVALGVRTRRRAWAVHLAVGAAFAAAQFVTAEAVHAALGVWPSHVADPTDLAALAVLPVGVWLALREPPARPSPVARRLALPVLAASVVAVAATSPPPRELLVEETTVLRAASPAQALAELDARLRALGVEAEREGPIWTGRWASDRDSLRVAAEQAGRVRYAVTVADPERPGLIARADLFTEWDPVGGQLSVVLFEPRSAGTRPEDRPAVRELLRTRVVVPLQRVGVGADLRGRY